MSTEAFPACLRPLASVLPPDDGNALFSSKCCSSLSYTPDGRYLGVSCGGAASAELCAGTTGMTLRTFSTVPRIFVAGVSVSPLDGRYIAAVG